MLNVRLRRVPVVQRIERGFPKAKQALLLESAPIVHSTQHGTPQELATTFVSSAVITNTPISDARVTQRVTQIFDPSLARAILRPYN
jgi:hypothetical protein